MTKPTQPADSALQHNWEIVGDAGPNWKLYRARSRLELSRFAADAIACCGADGGGDLS